MQHRKTRKPKDAKRSAAAKKAWATIRAKRALKAKPNAQPVTN